ncbi:MAG: hypothetical protein PsegKO_33080 [Pseudohongiellaceae bacterium]
MTRHISERGQRFIARAEGLRLRAYQDSAGVWTIGYGHTGPAARKGNVISEQEASRLLQADLGTAERAVSCRVKRPLNDDQFAALVSLVFNIGEGAFGRSTCLRRLNAGDETGALEALRWWRKAGGRLLAGLVRRREAEVRLWQGAADPWDDAVDVAVRAESSVREELSDSRTLRAAGGATAATGSLALLEAVNATGQQVSDAAALDWAWGRWLLIAIALVGLVIVIWARWSDWQEGKR